MTCWSEGMNSRAFWMTLQPYICRARDRTWPRILSARASFWSRLPNWKTHIQQSRWYTSQTLMHKIDIHFEDTLTHYLIKLTDFWLTSGCSISINCWVFNEFLTRIDKGPWRRLPFLSSLLFLQKHKIFYPFQIYVNHKYLSLNSWFPLLKA